MVEITAAECCPSLCSLIPITDRNTTTTGEHEAAQELVSVTAVLFLLALTDFGNLP